MVDFLMDYAYVALGVAVVIQAIAVAFLASALIRYSREAQRRDLAQKQAWDRQGLPPERK